MKRLLKAIIPQKLVTFIRALFKVPQVLKYYPRDIYRYLKYSSTLVENKNFDILNAKVIADAHIIDKALSLKNPRLGFGKIVIERLIEALKLYKIRNYDLSSNYFAYNFGVAMLYKYLEFNEKQNFDVSAFRVSIEKYLPKIENSENYSKRREFTKPELLKSSESIFPEFLKSRVSLRQFSDKPLDVKKIYSAIELAQNSPSVCNRQSAKIYIIEKKEILDEVLSIQHGNSGFGDQVDKVLLVCSDLSSFFGLQERHQAYIDGGLFAMSLLYSLTYYQIGACTLNWCAEAKRDRYLKALVNIKESEDVLMVIGLGSIPEEINVACSPKKTVEEISVLV